MKTRISPVASCRSSIGCRRGHNVLMVGGRIFSGATWAAWERRGMRRWSAANAIGTKATRPCWPPPTCPTACSQPGFDPDELLVYTQAYAGQVALLDMCLGGFLEVLDEDPAAAKTLLALTCRARVSHGRALALGTVRRGLARRVGPRAARAPFPRSPRGRSSQPGLGRTGRPVGHALGLLADRRRAACRRRAFRSCRWSARSRWRLAIGWSWPDRGRNGRSARRPGISARRNRPSCTPSLTTCGK